MKYIDFDMTGFLNWSYRKYDRTTKTYSENKYYGTLQEILENEVYEWRLQSDMPSWDIDENDKKEAIEYLHRQTNLSIEDIKSGYDEMIDRDIQRAYDDSYWCSYEDEWIKKYWSEVDNAITEAMQKAIKIVYVNSKTNEVENADMPLEANTVRVYITIDRILECEGYDRKSFTSEFGYKPDFEAVADFYHNHIMDEYRPVNTEYIAYYGLMGDTYEWMDFFKDYNESEGQIKKDLKTKQNRIKGMILNHVPFEYRLSA